MAVCPPVLSRPGRRIRILLPLWLAVAPAACRTAAATRTPDGFAEGDAWVTTSLLGDDPTELDRLASLAAQGPAGRVVRLDRLLDRFDAARFAGDENARESLWAALGGHPVGIGSDATRDATTRLLDEALAIESAADQGGELSPEFRRLLSDAIFLLSADLQRPATAEEVSIATSAFRELAERGHPRIADNARWRLYDHARGTLDGATRASPGERVDVAVQALYAQQESVEAYLTDGPDRSDPAGAEGLWAVVEQQRSALAEIPRWAEVVRARAPEDEALRDTLRTVLPAPRDPQWPAVPMPAGTGRADQRGPALIVRSTLARVDAGRPQARSISLQPEGTADPATELERALAATLSADGRGTLTLAMDPDLPAPTVHLVLRSVRRAQTSVLDVSISESAEGTPRLTALPLLVVRSADGSPTLAGLRAARVSVHLSGRGPRFAIDGDVLSAAPTTAGELRTLSTALARAFPRQRAVRLTLDPDVSVRQLVELLAALEGGPGAPPFEVVGWWAGGTPAGADGRGAGDRRFAARLAWAEATPALQQPYPLKGADQRKLEQLADRVRACLPEVESVPDPKRPVRIVIAFDQGQRVQASASGKRLDGARLDAVNTCIDEATLGARLEHHLERIEVSIGSD